MAVAIVDVEKVTRRLQTHDDEIGVAVVVDVARRDAAAWFDVREAGRSRHILKTAARVAVQNVGCIGPREEEIFAAVAVVVQNRDAAGHRFDAWRCRLQMSDSQVGGHVGESREGGGEIGVSKR